MNYLRCPHLIALALIVSTAACKATSSTSEQGEPATEEATQNVEGPAKAEPNGDEAEPESEPAGGDDEAARDKVVQAIDEEDESNAMSADDPMVIPLEFTVEGEVDKRIVERVFRSHRGETMFCYEESLEKDPEAAGILGLEFDISAEGRVENAQIDAKKLDDPELAKCVRTRLERWEFPKSTDGEPVSVSASFAFQSSVKTVVGSLDKDDIRAVIKKNRNQIRYCYEKELVKDKDLAGRVTMNFTVGKTGKVIAAKTKSTTLNSQAVESCMATVIREWEFPAPDGGGIVIINYPFDFSSSK